MDIISEFLSKNPATAFGVVIFVASSLLLAIARRASADADTQMLSNKQTRRMMDRLDNLEPLVAQLSAENAGFRTTISKMKQTDSDQQQEIDYIKTERDGYKKERDDALTGKAAAEGRVAELERRIDELERRIVEIMQEQNILKHENQELRAQLSIVQE